MKVYLEPRPGLSRSMTRVARALDANAPKGVEVVGLPAQADLIVLHVIGYPEVAEMLPKLRADGKQVVIAQYCFRSTQRPTFEAWMPLWQQCKFVWSYYDLNSMAAAEGRSADFGTFQSPLDARILCAPLGVDDEFRKDRGWGPDRTVLCITSGYVSGPNSEAIEEVAVAAERLEKDIIHLGPTPEGLSYTPKSWNQAQDVTDEFLAGLYRSSLFVSGLRHAEGFELPAAEGLCCGARPILFDRPEMRMWYGDHAVYVPECSGEELIGHLVKVMSTPRPVSYDELRLARHAFDWSHVAASFWQAVLS